MTIKQTQRVAVIGLGTMGPGIAQAFAQGGHRIVGFDKSAQAVDACRHMVDAICGTLEEFALLPSGTAVRIAERISYAETVEAAVAGADIVIEAVTENRDVKRAVFREADAHAPFNAMFWSNTSTLNVFDLIPDRRQPRTVIAHWFAPPHIIPLVEVVKGPRTDAQVVDKVMGQLKDLGKLPILIEKYLPGFVINRILRNLGREAFFLLDNNYISVEDLDLAVKASIAPRMMVLGLIQRYDFTGLDPSARNLLDESFFDPPVDNRPRALHERIDQGALGVKAGRGFYDYGGRTPAEVCQQRDRLMLRVMRDLRFCLEQKRLV